MSDQNTSLMESKKRAARGEDEVEESSPSGAKKPDVKGFFTSYVTKDLIQTLILGVVVFGTIAVFLSAQARQGAIPGIFDEGKVGAGFVPVHPIRENLTQNVKFVYTDKQKMASLFESRAQKSGIFNFMQESAKYVDESNGAIVKLIFENFGKLPEELVMLFGAVVEIITWVVLFMADYVLHMVALVQNLGDLLTKKNSGHDNSKLTWSQLAGRLFYACVHFWGIIWVFPLVTSLWSLIAPFYSEVSWSPDGRQSSKPRGFLEFARATLAARQGFVLLLASIFLCLRAYDYLGSAFAAAAVVATFGMWYKGAFTSSINTIPASLKSTFEAVKKEV